MISKLKTIFLALSLIFLTVNAHAALKLSVNPISGGNGLHLGRVETGDANSKEVRIRITSTDGKQYQVFQRIVDALINEKGETLGADAITAYGLNGSNASGTLYAQAPETLGYSEQLLYSSSPNGDSDNLTVVYSVRPERLSGSGNFVGRIQYTVRSIGGSGQDVVYLSLYMDALGEFKIDVEGSSSKTLVRIETQPAVAPRNYVKVAFTGNYGSQVKIYQEADNYFQNEIAEDLNKDLIQFTTEGETKGELYFKAPAVLERKKVLLYSSNQTDDTFFVNFVIDQGKFDYQKAGRYRGKLKYTIETDGALRSFDIDSEINIDPVFNLEVKLPANGVRFANILPDSPPQLSEVEVRVKSNLGKPYMVMQNVISPLTNEKGFAIPREFFSMKGELSADSVGKASNVEFSPVSSGEAPVFFSDSKGASGTFKIIYRLKAFPEIESGNYTTSIVYSLGEM